MMKVRYLYILVATIVLAILGTSYLPEKASDVQGGMALTNPQLFGQIQTVSPTSLQVSTYPSFSDSTPVRWYAPDPSLSLMSDLQNLAPSLASRVSISLIDLSEPYPLSWSYGGENQFVAASTYKAVALMDEAQMISNGQRSPSSPVCFRYSDWEDGFYEDYRPGVCYSLQELAIRAGQASDNTAGHMLVRDLGGAGALNAFAQRYGAIHSQFFVNNITTSDDLARLWAAEAKGEMGGTVAQQWLYPLLTHTFAEGGIPAGVPGDVQVVHKVGAIDDYINDAGYIAGPRPYVLAIMTEGGGSWTTDQQISERVWQYETSRWS